MICDAHCHLKHGDAEATEYTPEAIVEIMDAAAIAKAVVFAISTDSRRAHELAAVAVQKFPERLIPFAYAIPDFSYPAVKEIERAIGELGFRGIKIHGGQTSLNSQLKFLIDPVFELAGRLDVPCLVDFVGRSENAERLATDFPNVKIIVAHLGRYRCSDQVTLDNFIRLAEEHENLVLDISGVALTWMITDAVKRVGSQRVVFGIDGPHPYPTPEEYAQAEIRKVKSLGLAEKDLANIMYNSIAELLKFD